MPVDGRPDHQDQAGPLDFSAVRTYSIQGRHSKVSVADFARMEGWNVGDGVEKLFPRILKGRELAEVAERWVKASLLRKPVILALGGHVIKCGLSPLLIDLMHRGVVTALALTGAGAVHDFEVALVGHTSEDVAAELGEGRFGMAEETGAGINGAFNRNVPQGLGLGEALGRELAQGDFPYKGFSLMAAAHTLSIPLTIHQAIGTDIIHMHPTCDGAVLGQGSYRDFRRLTTLVAQLDGGGCFFNLGSAVVLPEVFLKALSLARNLRGRVSDFMTVNLDMIQHYRPNVNVVQRPHVDQQDQPAGGLGYALTGHHEIMVPLLYAMVRARLDAEPVLEDRGRVAGDPTL